MTECAYREAVILVETANRFLELKTRQRTESSSELRRLCLANSETLFISLVPHASTCGAKLFSEGRAFESSSPPLYSTSQSPPQKKGKTKTAALHTLALRSQGRFCRTKRVKSSAPGEPPAPLLTVYGAIYG